MLYLFCELIFSLFDAPFNNLMHQSQVTAEHQLTLKITWWINKPGRDKVDAISKAQDIHGDPLFLQNCCCFWLHSSDWENLSEFFEFYNLCVSFSQNFSLFPLAHCENFIQIVFQVYNNRISGFFSCLKKYWIIIPEVIDFEENCVQTLTKNIVCVCVYVGGGLFLHSCNSCA